MDKKLLTALINVEKAGFSGWDFSRLKGRITEEKPPWAYAAFAKRLIRKSNSVLDVGTGGGELFATLGPFPKHTFATEGYKPNVAIARARLKKSGVTVLEAGVKLPFRAGEFDLVLNRHSAFDSNEVYRVLKKGGTFLTQQVSGDNLQDLASRFKTKGSFSDPSKDSKVLQQLESVGFAIVERKAWHGKVEFKDLGSLVYFLKAIPWVVPGFSVRKHLRFLEKLQGKKLIFNVGRFFILAKKNKMKNNNS